MTTPDELTAMLDQWEHAYPLSMFPEPDLERVAAVLKDHGMTLDSVSASNMRHVVGRIAPMARDAIEDLLARIAALEGERERLRAHIAEQIQHVETRIADGKGMGAAVWRIALEEVARENRAAIEETDQ